MNKFKVGDRVMVYDSCYPGVKAKVVSIGTLVTVEPDNTSYPILLVCVEQCRKLKPKKKKLQPAPLTLEERVSLLEIKLEEARLDQPQPLDFGCMVGKVT